jgi:hypothetical protein
MKNYVNLNPLQVLLEDLLYSIRYLSDNEYKGLITDDDILSFENKSKEVHSLLATLLKIDTPLTDQQKYFSEQYDSNHIKEARLKIFCKVLQSLITFNNLSMSGKTIIDIASDTSNDAIKKLYGV